MKKRISDYLESAFNRVKIIPEQKKPKKSIGNSAFNRVKLITDQSKIKKNKLK